MPGYRASSDYERRINRYADGRRPVVGEAERRNGMSMLPGERFGGQRTVDVPRRNRTTMPPPVMQSLPLSTAPPPAASWQRPAVVPRVDNAPRRDWVNRPGRLQTDDGQTSRPPMPQRPSMPAAPPQPPVPAQPVMPAMPVLPPVQDHVGRQPGWRGEERARDERPRAERPPQERPPQERPFQERAPQERPAQRPFMERERAAEAPRQEREHGPRREMPPPAAPAPAPAAVPRPAPPPPAARPAQEARSAERANPPRERNNERNTERGNPGRSGRPQEAER